MSRFPKRRQGGFVRLPSSPWRAFGGHQPGEDRAAAHNREVTYLRALTMYAMR